MKKSQNKKIKETQTFSLSKEEKELVLKHRAKQKQKEKLATIPKKVLNDLEKEYQELNEGKTIKLKMPAIKVKDIPVNIYWEGSSKASFDYDMYDLETQILKSVDDEIIEHSIKSDLKKFNVQINNFNTKLSNLEKKYGLDQNQIWQELLGKM